MENKTITASEFKKNLNEYRDFQYRTDPYLASAVDFLCIPSWDISEEAVLTSLLRCGYEIVKD